MRSVIIRFTNSILTFEGKRAIELSFNIIFQIFFPVFSGSTNGFGLAGGAGVGGILRGAGSCGFGLFDVGGVGICESDLVAVLSTLGVCELPVCNMLFFFVVFISFPSLIASMSAFTFKRSFFVWAKFGKLDKIPIVAIKISFFIVQCFLIQPPIVM